ncbi:MAG: radical SAM family heme chaperone HemW [Hyphomicrobiaceae bacterium]|nr:radical SAM family heme chaperone HemW [Hyphomicrobiaceae bacterium]
MVANRGVVHGDERLSNFGVYVHWPFCAQKCPYCDFNSHVRHGGWDESAYVEAYLAELKSAAAGLSGRKPVDSIFFGGGTPSLMQPSTVAAIIDAIAETFGLAPGCEITLEANPGSVEAGRFRGYRTAGVNRVSLGVQALDDEQLKRLGRIHTVREAMAAFDIGRSTFERVSFDLIYARPGMTEALWEAELRRALSLQAGHLSLYQLTIEDGTPFAALHRAGKLIVPEPDLADRLYELTQEMCETGGLPAYEISNHARPGEESRHNLVYWRYGTYIGLGPGAHGREVRGIGRVATVNERSPETWLGLVDGRGRGLVEEARLSPEEQADEMLLMGLRLAEGVDLDRLVRLSGRAPGRRAVDRLIAMGMLERRPERRLRATARGRFVLNEIVRQLSVGLEVV